MQRRGERGGWEGLGRRENRGGESSSSHWCKTTRLILFLSPKGLIAAALLHLFSLWYVETKTNAPQCTSSSVWIRGNTAEVSLTEHTSNITNYYSNHQRCWIQDSVSVSVSSSSFKLFSCSYLHSLLKSHSCLWSLHSPPSSYFFHSYIITTDSLGVSLSLWAGTKMTQAFGYDSHNLVVVTLLTSKVLDNST